MPASMNPAPNTAPVPNGDHSFRTLRRGHILDAASRAFAVDSYRGADLASIASQLHLSKASIYRYFTSKEDLFLQAVEHGVARLHEHVAASRAGLADPLARLRAALTAYLGFFRDHPEVAELLVQERAEFKHRQASSYLNQREKTLSQWRETLQALMDAHQVRDLSVDRIIEVLGCVLDGAVFANHLMGGPRRDADQAQDIIDIVLSGIVTGPGDNPSVVANQTTNGQC